MTQQNLSNFYDFLDSKVEILTNMRQEMKDQNAARDEQSIVQFLESKTYEVDHIDIASICLILDLSNDGDNVILIKCDVSILDGGSSTQYGAEYGSYETYKQNSLTVNQIVIEDDEGYQPYGYPITNDAIIEAVEKEVQSIYDLNGYL